VPTIIVPLKDIQVDEKDHIDLSALSDADAIERLRKIYGFLSPTTDISIKNGMVTITLPEETTQRADEALKWFRQGVKQAEQGEFKRASRTFERVVERLPGHVEARRNVAMAHLELGHIKEAKRLLMQVLQLNPNDTWSYMLLGNIAAKHENDFERAAEWYRRAYELNPQDAILLTNYGALMVERRAWEQAEEFFTRAIQANPSYPNSYYALALLDKQNEKPEQTLEVLHGLFAKTRPVDMRSAGLYDEARKMYLEANRALAEQTYDQVSAFI
jgi:tetratricopeptide (TPR) repeat protein